jgi:hypothetical protein
MCRFISMAVENVAEARRIFAGYALWDNENKSFKSEVPAKFEMLWVTDGHCSCGFYSKPYDPIVEKEKLIKRFSKPKYRKKGWSPERIEREVEAILNKPKVEGGLSRPLFSCLQSYTSEAGCCYFHMGWYSGDPDRQGLRIDKRLNVTISSGAIGAVEIYENVLYEFT